MSAKFHYQGEDLLQCREWYLLRHAVPAGPGPRESGRTPCTWNSRYRRWHGRHTPCHHPSQVLPWSTRRCTFCRHCRATAPGDFT